MLKYVELWNNAKFVATCIYMYASIQNYICVFYNILTDRYI